jgi:hypothetical protein
MTGRYAPRRFAVRFSDVICHRDDAVSASFAVDRDFVTVLVMYRGLTVQGFFTPSDNRVAILVTGPIGAIGSTLSGVYSNTCLQSQTASRKKVRDIPSQSPVSINRK